MSSSEHLTSVGYEVFYLKDPLLDRTSNSLSLASLYRFKYMNKAQPCRQGLLWQLDIKTKQNKGKMSAAVRRLPRSDQFSLEAKKEVSGVVTAVVLSAKRPCKPIT
jgi:hypothetical protein